MNGPQDISESTYGRDSLGLQRLRRETKNAKNLHIWIFWAKNAKFLTAFGQNEKKREFFQKALGTFFSQLHALTNCKLS